MFRRRKNTFVPYSEQPYTYDYALTFGLPQPWLHHPERENILHLPLQFLQPFVDSQYLNRIRNFDGLKIAPLRESLFAEGQKEPCILLLDPNGKLRFHDGYHRMAVFLECPDVFVKVPCLVQPVNSPIKGHGRRLSDETEHVLAWLTRWRP